MQHTTSQVIYDAWRSTSRPLIYHTSDGKGNQLEKEVHFLRPEDNRYYDPDYDGVCNLCGRPCHGGTPVKKLLGSSYMDWWTHRAPQATHICNACSFCLTMNPEGRIALFRYPLVAEKQLHLCNRKELRDWLTDPPEPPFVMILPTSQKKHLFMKARVSYQKTCFWCNLEELVVTIKPGFKDLVETIEMLRGLGINKTQITEGTIPQAFFKTYGIAQADRALTMIDKIRRDPAFALAMEVAQKMTEEDALCCMDLKQTTK